MKDWLDLLQEIDAAEKAEPMYMQIMRRIRASIESAELAENTKLPTNRELAALLKVDRSTVSRAYAELSQAGWIESHVGRGTFVRPKMLRSQPNTLSNGSLPWADKFSRASRTVSEIMLKQPPPVVSRHGLISFAGGLPTEEFYPHDQFERIVAEIVQSPLSHEMFGYSPAEGHSYLRAQVLNHLAEQNISAEEDELLIVSGSQQALDLVSNVFVDPGDTIFLEEPSYFWAICNFRARQARCVGVPTDDGGLRLDVLDSYLSGQRAKLIYSMPSFQNPTGASLSLERRMRLIELARKHQVPILEDNFVGDLWYDAEPVPPLRALPGGRDVVIHQGTFSKALCPGLRLGWLLAPCEVMSRLLTAKRVSDLSTNSMAQITLARYLAEGLYGDHLNTVRAAYRSRRDAMIAALNHHFNFGSGMGAVRPQWTKPQGGLFIWFKLPQGMSARDLLPFGEDAGVTFSPGELFFQAGDRAEYLRLCFIQTSEEQIDEGIKRLSQAFNQYAQTINQGGAATFGALARNRDHALI